MSTTVTAAESLAPACESLLWQMSRFGVLAADFYLLLGHAQPSRPLPDHIARGEMKQCYMNAGRLARDRPEFSYCEGYAKRAGLFPLHHAWCLDADGVVLDPTWPYDPDNEYWGVSLDTAFMLKATTASGVWGVLSEMLPPDIVAVHPQSYLHAEWRPDQARMDAFWDKLQVIVQKGPGAPS